MSKLTDKRHKALWAACKCLPQDYTPYGKEKRWADPKKAYPDCSGCCLYYEQLYDPVNNHDDTDWGVCTNPKSHRCGLLTFEHQGCLQFRSRVTIATTPFPHPSLSPTQRKKVRAVILKARREHIERQVAANRPAKK